MDQALAAATFHAPETRRVDAALVAGAAVFGAGWGLTGLCPGPAVAGLALKPGAAGLFAAAMIGGMALHQATAAQTRTFGTARSNMTATSSGDGK